MEAILRTFNKDISHQDEIIEVSDNYDFGRSPYEQSDEEKCPIIGSNQQIIPIED